MRLNLECGDDIRNGYTNVNSVPVNLTNLPEGAIFVIGHYGNLDPVVKDQVDEIIFNPLLNILNPAEVVPVISHWCSKLKPGGILKLAISDIKKVARSIHLEDINLQEIHNLIYGPNGEFKSVMDTSVVKVLGPEFGMTIDTIATESFFVTVEMVKNAEN